MAAAKDKAGADPADKDKDQDKKEAKAVGSKPRELNRQELEALRQQLQKKFHRP